jgi:crotonobetainyl-CoA:carnitine CoA-transferase CaiB-like acyl-CoA transferase
VTALRPSALERLGLGWDALHARHPLLCHVAVTGFAAADADAPGHDLTYQARAGLLLPPAMPRTLLADLAGGERAALAGATLLLARERGGGARRADVSLAEAALPFADPLRFGLTAPDGVLGGALPGYGLYAARDGWVAVAALEPHFWRRLCDALGVPEARADRAALERAFAAEDARHWERWGREHALPIAAVRAPASPNEQAPDRR